MGWLEVYHVSKHLIVFSHEATAALPPAMPHIPFSILIAFNKGLAHKLCLSFYFLGNIGQKKIVLDSLRELFQKTSMPPEIPL